MSDFRTPRIRYTIELEIAKHPTVNLTQEEVLDKIHIAFGVHPHQAQIIDAKHLDHDGNIVSPKKS